MQRRFSTIGLIPFLLLAGCSQSRVQPVFVDIDRILQVETIVSSSVNPTPPAPHSQPTNGTLSAEAERTVAGANTLVRRKQIEELIASNRRDAEADLADRLRRAYLNEVELAEADLLEKHSLVSKEKLAAALGAFRPIFDDYAIKRSPKIVRLSMIAGFPDGDPKSTKKRIGVIRAVQFAEEARILREQLAEIEREFQFAASAFLETVDKSLSEALIAIRLDIEGRRLAADARAKKEAAELVLKQTASLDDVAMDQTPMHFAPSAQQTPRIQAQPADPATLPGPLGSSDVKMKKRRALELEAEVWAATSGFKLSTSRTAPERTSEFLTWRQKHRAGP